MLARFFVFSLFILTLFGGGTLKAQTPAQDDLVLVRILPEHTHTDGLKTLQIAIEQSIKPEWHTYWINPGDSGSEPRAHWTLPDGFSISDIQWPAPKKLPYGSLLNYGYDNQAILLQELTLPEVMPDGPLRLRADIEILVCKDECIPVFSQHEIILNDPDMIPKSYSAYMEQARQALPVKIDTPATWSKNKDRFVLRLDPHSMELFSDIAPESLELFPVNWGLIDNAAAPQAVLHNEMLYVTQAYGDRSPEDVKIFEGVLRFKNHDDSQKSYTFEAEYTGDIPITLEPSGPNKNPSLNLLQALIFAVIGGTILNLMPCVFPVLSIKALSLVKLAEKNPGHARLHGLAYMSGIILSFLIVASALIVFKIGGAQIGWGFQLQNPVIISLLAYILFLTGLNLSGFFELGTAFANTGQSLTQGSGLSSSFFTGVLATLVATPCTAPFMAPALGFTLTQTAPITLSVFAALGFGLALPYLLLSFVPALQKRLPKPGRWMDVFKQFLAFPMFASGIWLIWVLSRQIGAQGVLTALSGMLVLTFGIWVFKNLPEDKPGRIAGKIIATGLLISTFLFLPYPIEKNDQSFGKPYTPEKLDTLLETELPVFVEMTADWCITCKINHRIALNTASTKDLFKNRDVQYLIGDWTNYDPDITKFLNNYGRDGVPVYVYYAPPAAGTRERPPPVVLPQLLTPGTVRNAITTP